MEARPSKHILYAGNLFSGSTAAQRAQALSGLGYSVDLVDFDYKNDIGYRFYNATKRFTGLEVDFLRINTKILNAWEQKKYDILWVDKGLFMSRSSLEHIRESNEGSILIHYSPDDMMNPSNQSNKYLSAISAFDYHITTKSYNVSELKAAGAKSVIFVGNSYDSKIHRPMEISAAEMQSIGCDVGFIGAYESERGGFIERLAQGGQPIVVRSKFWKSPIPPNLKVITGWFADEEYSKIISATKINLCFLRKVNRDLQTTRSVEIPACGGFMLAERTDEHQALFLEGKEAEFFSSYEEMEDKVKFYLSRPELRIQIAEAGRKRCVTQGYSNADRIAEIMGEVFKEKS